MLSRLVFTALALATCSTLAAQTPPPKGTPPTTETHFELFPSPSLRVKDLFRIDFHVKAQEDHRRFPAEIQPDNAWTLSRERLGVEGVALKVFEYRVEHDFAAGGRWTDVFLDYRPSDAIAVRGGKFKQPFSLEQTTSDFNLPFVLRPAIARDLAPGRARGAMAHGRATQRVSYEAGIFRDDGEVAKFGDNVGGDTTIAGRARVEPWRTHKTSAFRNLQIGVAATECLVPEGLNSLRARAIDGSAIFRRTYVNGRRVRFGTELSWMPGAVGVRSEFIQVWEDRHGQGISGEDLPRVSTGGWYVSGSWLLTGERAGSVPPPKEPLFQGGIGALEAAVRYERLQSGSDAPGEPDEDSPRAANLVESRYGAWTFGLNWYVNRWGKIQFNIVRESLDPPSRSKVPGRAAYWSTLARFQFVL